MELALTVPGEAEAKAAVEVSAVTFGREFNESLVHQVVVAYLAGGRQGTRAQKNRSAVRGGGAKPWRQKGTGRARAGTIRSPLWRKGGVTFAAQPQDHSQKVNRKMYRGAMCCILSELVRQSRLQVVESFQLDQPKTRDMAAKLKTYDASSDVLIIDAELAENVYLASRNLPKVTAVDVQHIDPVTLIAYEKVIITVAAIKSIEEALA